MNTWFRKVGVGAVALTLAGVLAGCNNGNGGGGSNLIQLFFGINGNGNCSQVIVEVDLDAANAIIARDEEGFLQCALNSALDSAGCDFNPVILENGNLRATISDCTIPAVTNLFSCMFEDVDLSELQETASAICACRTEGCDGNPPVCISEDPDPTSCEDCTNGRDDDDNDLIDCEDPNCRNSPACQETTTTSTTSTSVTVSSTTTTDTVTTSSTTTTSTTNPLDLSCRVVFTLEDDVTAGALQFDVDYSDVPGTLPGSGLSAQCAKLAGAVFALNDVDATQTVTMGFVDLDGLAGPNLDVAECQFKASAIPLKSDFAITVTDATDTSEDSLPIEPLPTVKVSTISCEGSEPTTTLPVETTTTLDVVTTTTIDTVTTTTLGGGAQNYDITFSLTTASAPLGALQLDVNYAAAPGGFKGSGATVSCSKAGTPLPALLQSNDNEATTSLTMGFVDLDGMTAPRQVSKCTFEGNAGDPPVPGDFVITIVDSTNADGDPVDSTVTATVTVAP